MKMVNGRWLESETGLSGTRQFMCITKMRFKEELAPQVVFECVNTTLINSLSSMLVLAWADILVAYVMWMLMIYLTDVWKLTITHASAIINVYTGVIATMPLIMQILVDTLGGNYWMLMLSSLASCTGMGLLAMSTPPVLSKPTGTCDAYEPECISDTQQILFYTALVLIAVGLAGHATSLVNFIAEQLMDALEDFSLRSIFTAYAGNITTFLITAAAVLGLPYVKPWSLRFGIPAMFMLVATLIFLNGTSTCTRIGPQGSHLTMVLRVFIAFASKLFRQRPADRNELYQMHFCTIPRTHSLGCLDRAAIVLPNLSLEEQQNNRWKLCTVLEVEATKLVISLVPMAMSFLFLGFLSPLVVTYFVEQAKTMNHNVGSLTIPVTIFLWFHIQAKEYFPKLYFKVSPLLSGSISSISTTGLVVSMILAVLCCVTAAKVESHRLDIVNSHGLLDKPDEKIPMSVFWLLPQFILLGAVDGMYENSIASFFSLYFTPTLNKYMLFFGAFVYGLGCIGSILLVHVVSNITERGGEPSWFHATINRSRLDNYFWLLSVLMAINLVMFLIVRLCYRCCSRKEQEQNGFEESEDCCCC